MDAQKGKLLESTKFLALDDSERSESGKKRRLLWVFVAFVVLVFFTVIAYLFHWGVTLPGHENQENQIFSSTFLQDDDEIFSDLSRTNHSINIFNRNVWALAGTQNEATSKHSSNHLDSNCGESEEQLSAIPRFYILPTGNNHKIYLTDIHNFIYMDLLIYYERVINKYNSKRLKLIFNDFQQKLSSIRKPEDFIKFLNSLNSNKFSFYTAYLEEYNYDLKLEHYKNYFSLTEELRNWYFYLDSFRNFLSHYQQLKNKENYRGNITEKCFGQFITKTQEKLFRFAYTFNVTQKKLQEINQIIVEWTDPLKTAINGSLITFHNKALLSSELKDTFRSLYTPSIKNVYVFASHTVYLDEDLTMPGINLAIIAPNWVFLKKIKINLNGLDGKDHETEMAEEGLPGKPGNPGGNAGDFLGIGDINEKFLDVYCNGGKGGNGQNGAKGRDGINYSRPSYPAEKPSCVTKLSSFQNPFNQTVTHYKIFSEAGCGTPGKDGGKRGIGGKGGKIIIISKTSKLKVSNGLDGMNGFPGKGGEGGTGGRNGCYYEALDVDDEVLNGVTTVRCVFDNVLPSGKSGRDNSNIEGQVLPSMKENLWVSDSLLGFELFAGKHFIKYSDEVAHSFFNELNQQRFIYNLTGPNYVFKEFKMFEMFDNIEFYELLKNKINVYLRPSENNNQGTLSFLKYLVLGKILLLTRNIDYSFLDFTNYLNSLQKNVENIDRGLVKRHPNVYLKTKVENKLEKISENLHTLNYKLKVLDEKNNEAVETLVEDSQKEMEKNKFCKNLGDALQERRIVYVMLTVVQIMTCFVGFTQNQSFSKGKLEFKNAVTRYLLSFDRMEKKKEDFFDSVNLTSDQKQIMSKVLMSATEFREYSRILMEACDCIRNLWHEEETLFEKLKNFSDKKVSGGRQLVEDVKNAVDFFARADGVSDEGKMLIQALVDELEHLIALYYFIEWHELELSFTNGLDILKFEGPLCYDCDEEEKFVRTRIHDVIVRLQYKLAVDAAQQRVFPFINLEKHLLATHNRTIVNEALIKINSLREITKQIPFCRNNHEAVFDKNSAVGEFYLWPNRKVRNKLKDLFGGNKIELKSDLNNRHVLDKNFLKFKFLRLEFDCGEEGNTSLCENVLINEVLNNFKITLTHSGYSYYNWKGETLIVVSDEVTFDYSLKICKNGEPEFYNTIFKKFQNGDVMLSPYTTWTVQLLPINDAASYEKLIPIIDDVDLRITGTGTFIS